MVKTLTLSYNPHKNIKQLEAHQALERYILYGGAYGGGKTAWLVNEGIRLSLAYPGNVGFLGCHYLTDFRDNALKQLEKFLPPELIQLHHKTERYFKLQWTGVETEDSITGKVKRISSAGKNAVFSSIIMYGGLGNDVEAVKAISNMPELGWFGIDQAEQITEKQFLLLDGRLRLVLPDIKYKALITANPEPGWLRDRFIEGDYPDHRFIPALPRDNPFLAPDYEDKLREIYPEAMVKRLLEGDWDIEIEGNYLIPYRDIRDAINRDLPAEGDKVAGLDIARYGSDETVFILRQGKKVLHIESWAQQDTVYSAGRTARLLRVHKPVVTYVDSIGVGAGVFDPLKAEGFPVVEINVGEKALDSEQYFNRRAEYYNLLAKKFQDGEIDIPDDGRLASHLAGIKYKYRDTKLLIESKEIMRKHGGKSPDYADALMLAFIDSKVGKARRKTPVWRW